MKFIKSMKTKALAVFTVLCMLAGSAGVYVSAETGYEVRFTCHSNAGNGGSIQYKTSSADDFRTVEYVPATEGSDAAGAYKSIKLDNTATSIMIKLVPGDKYTVDTGRGVKLMYKNSSVINSNGENANVTIDEFTSENGYTINLNGFVKDDDKRFELEFGFAEVPTHSVNFGEGEWTVNGVTVKSDKKGTNDITDKDIITLTNFNPNTMIAKVSAADGFGTTLNVSEGKTSLSARIESGGYPNGGTLTFSVEVKPNDSQGSDGSGNQGSGSSGVDYGEDDEGKHPGYENGTEVISTLEMTGDIDFDINNSTMIN